MTEPRDMTAHVTACAWLRTPHTPPTYECPICHSEPPAGYLRCPVGKHNWKEPDDDTG